MQTKAAHGIKTGIINTGQKGNDTIPLSTAAYCVSESLSAPLKYDLILIFKQNAKKIFFVFTSNCL